MKPFLGIDLTENKNNDKLNGNEFIIQVPSSTMTQSLEASSEKAEETIDKSKLPLPLRIIQSVCGVVGTIIVLGLIKSLFNTDGVTVAQAYNNAPFLFWISGISLAVWGVLKIMSNQKAKEILESEESNQVFSKLDSVGKSIYSELGVPSDSKEVDILSFFYKIKDDRIKVCEKSMAQYFNPEFNIFTDSENLYIANLEGKYAFPLSSLKAIHKVKKHIRILSWNKEENFNKGIYKQYKLTNDNYGCIHCKNYYILEINCDNESYGIYFPCYELPAFEELTGLKAQ